MSENRNCRIDDLSKYDTMKTEELEEILRLDAQASEERDSDTDVILYIMEVLTKRKRNSSHAGKTAQEAYESFKQNYMTETDNEEIKCSPKCDKKKNRLCWFRTLSATAAVLAIIILGSVTAQAFGVNIWEAVVKWTQETFHFGEWGNSDPNDNSPYSSLQEALEQSRVTTPLAPTWFPTGYELVDIKIDQTPLEKIYRAKYASGEQVLRITVSEYLNSEPVYVEQSEGLVEEYKLSGISYYLFSNYDNVKAVWIVDSFECYISGNVTIDELKQMINSIEKG